MTGQEMRRRARLIFKSHLTCSLNVLKLKLEKLTPKAAARSGPVAEAIGVTGEKKAQGGEGEQKTKNE
jgi:hypothetical protein